MSVLELDLADLDQVTVAAATFAVDARPPRPAVNNAGLMAIPKQTTVQGYEMQLGVNHLAHFALTGRLLDRLLATPGSRVVSISSQGHRPGRIAFDDLQSERSYGPWKAYFQSKLANLLFIAELQRRLTAADASTLALAAHPGGSRTNLGHENPGGIINTLGHVGRPLIEKRRAPERGDGRAPHAAGGHRSRRRRRRVLRSGRSRRAAGPPEGGRSLASGAGRGHGPAALGGLRGADRRPLRRARRHGASRRASISTSLAAWMDAQGLGSGPLRDVEPIAGGTQNILLRFTRADREYVFRRPPLHKRANSDDVMRREARDPRRARRFRRARIPR